MCDLRMLVRRGLKRSMASFAFSPPAPSTVSIAGEEAVFPVRRIYCVGRNYYDHAVEMQGRHRELGIAEGTDVRDPPFFFQKAGYGAVVDTSRRSAVVYPPGTRLLEFECELVVGLAARCRPEAPLESVGFYGVGCDLTRRDLQNEAKAQRRPWDAAKNFDDSAPCGPLARASPDAGLSPDAVMTLTKNGQVSQQTTLGLMIFSVEEALRHLARQVGLEPGDLVYTGTPAGVGPLQPGDAVECTIKDAAGVDLVPRCTFSVVDAGAAS